LARAGSCDISIRVVMRHYIRSFVQEVISNPSLRRLRKDVVRLYCFNLLNSLQPRPGGHLRTRFYTRSLRAAAMQSLRPTPAKPPLTFALANVVERATKRAIDGQRIFSPIATLWDEYLESKAVRALAQGLRPPLLRLYKDISTLATRHFDTYIKGSSLPRLTDTPPVNIIPDVIPPPLPPPPPAVASAPALTSTTPL